MERLNSLTGEITPTVQTVQSPEALGDPRIMRQTGPYQYPTQPDGAQAVPSQPEKSMIGTAGYADYVRPLSPQNPQIQIPAAPAPEALKEALEAAAVPIPENIPIVNETDGADAYLHSDLAQIQRMVMEQVKEEDERFAIMDNIAKNDSSVPNLGEPAVSTVEAPISSRSKEFRRNINADSESSYDFDDLTPGYSDDELDSIDAEPDKTAAPEPEPEDDDSEANRRELAEQVKSYENVDVASPEKTAVSSIRDPRVRIVPSKKNSGNTSVGNAAFASAILRYKKDNFGVVTVPLVNSGFCVDVVGTGVVDLQNLYTQVEENTDPSVYQINQMRTVIRNIVNTHPKVRSTALSSMIHFQDFQMLMYGHLCATINKIQTALTCPHCGQNFRCSIDSYNLLLNEDDLFERRRAIEDSPNIESYSLLAKNRVVETSSGITVTLSHPSYAEYLAAIRGRQSFVEDMDDITRAKFNNMTELLQLIRKVEIPGYPTSSNMRQHYDALGLLSDSEWEAVYNAYEDMRKEILVPRFGVREIMCPHCGKQIKNTRFDSLAELLFFHITVSNLLRQA